MWYRKVGAIGPRVWSSSCTTNIFKKRRGRETKSSKAKIIEVDQVNLIIAFCKAVMSSRRSELGSLAGLHGSLGHNKRVVDADYPIIG